MAETRGECQAFDCDVTGQKCEDNLESRWQCECGRNVCSTHITWTKGSGSYEICYHCEQVDEDGECYCGEEEEL